MRAINFLPKKTSNIAFILLLLISCMYSSAWAEGDQSKEIREQQQSLKELLDSIGEAQEQRKEQRATLKKLEKQMSCNMTLIQDYENCEKQYKDNLEAHVKCKHEAKQRAADCLSSSDE